MRAVPIHPILLAPSLLKNEKFIQKVISLTKLKKILHRNIKLCCYYQTKKNKKKPKKKKPKTKLLGGRSRHTFRKFVIQPQFYITYSDHGGPPHCHDFPYRGQTPRGSKVRTRNIWRLDIDWHVLTEDAGFARLC